MDELKVGNHLVFFPEVPGPLTKKYMCCTWILLAVMLFGLPVWSSLFNDYSHLLPCPTALWGSKCQDVPGWQPTCNVNVENLLCNQPNGTSIPYEWVIGNMNSGNNPDKWVLWGREILGGGPLVWGATIDRNINGTQYGCAAGQGIIGDWACIGKTPFSIMESGYFSVSYYVATASGTGLFAMFAFFPFLFFWIYGPASKAWVCALNVEGLLQQEGCSIPKYYATAQFVMGVSQVFFQIFFGLFQVFGVSYWPTIHGTVVIVFVISEITHFVAASYMMGLSQHFEARMVAVLALLSGVCVTVGLLIGAPVPGSGLWYLNQRLPYFLQRRLFMWTECIGLTIITGITPYIWHRGLLEKVSVELRMKNEGYTGMSQARSESPK